MRKLNVCLIIIMIGFIMPTVFGSNYTTTLMTQGGSSGGSVGPLLTANTEVSTQTASSDTCAKYHTCPDGSVVQYCFLSEMKSEDGSSAGGGCGCVTPEKLCKTSESVKEENSAQTTTSNSGGSVTPVVQSCPVDEELTEEYNNLLKELGNVDSTASTSVLIAIYDRIDAVKEKIKKAEMECSGVTVSAVSTGKIVSEMPVEISATVTSISKPVPIDRCSTIGGYEKKYVHYKELYSLSDSELNDKGYSGREDIEMILEELSVEIEEIKKECQKGQIVGITSAVGKIEPTIMMDPVIPVAVDSGSEIRVYYKTKVESIRSLDNVDEHIEGLTELRVEIDNLIEELIKSKDTISADDMENLVTKISISPGVIKADNVEIRAVRKKIVMDIDNKNISVEPTEKNVVIKDGNLEINTNSVSIEKNILKVGDSEVSVAASDVIDELGISPESVELVEEDRKAVYNIKVIENRKLFGLITIAVNKDYKVDAGNGNLIEENKPWYMFLTSG